MAGKRNKNKKKKKKILTILLAVCLLLIALMVGVYAFVYSKLNKINKMDEATHSVVSPTEAPVYSNEIDSMIASGEASFEDDEGNPVPEGYIFINGELVKIMDPSELDFGGAEITVLNDADIENILLVGSDARPGNFENMRSDTMILCSINKRTDTITMISLMRDMMVEIPGYYSHKLNEAYYLGGFQLLNQTIEHNFGIHIDGNVELDFESFIGVIAELGPITIELNQEEADYLNTKVPGGGLVAGPNEMDGERLLWYARTRKVGNGDFERTERARRILLTMYSNLRGYSPTDIITMVDRLFPLMTTNLTNNQILGYAVKVLAEGLTLNQETYRIPADGSFTTGIINDMWVMVPDFAANSNYLKHIMYGVNAG